MIDKRTAATALRAVFLIQNTQNWDVRATHLGLDESVRAVGRRKKLSDVESNLRLRMPSKQRD